jgi:uncharacterized protein
MIFEIHAERSFDDKKIFYYDNEKNTLTDENGDRFEYPNITPDLTQIPVRPFSKEDPLKKSRDVTTVKIQMGLSCNYSCDYCSQKFVERPKETNSKDIENFMKLFNELRFSENTGLKVEFWGGEPFVYWKTMKPLAEAIRANFSDWKNPPKFSVITNGSILSEEICDWLCDMGFSVSISHDGPGQFVRGPDPFEDEKTKTRVLNLYKKLKPQGRISFNSMLNAKNISRKQIYDWFVDFTGDPEVTLGEGGIVDAYDEDGLENSLHAKRDHFNYRQQSFKDIYENDGKIGFFGVLNKVDQFTRSLLSHRESQYVNQKCGMDNENTIAIDLRGNVLTCQNVSALETSKNGESHLGGNLADFDNVELKSATHWMNRKECSGCPVLHICQGACMFLDGKFWETSCNNAYSDAIPLFALSFEKITDGYIPVLINNSELPLERQDIWGTMYEHKDEPVRKIIPIKVISDEKTIVEGLEVYAKAKVIEGEI